MPAREGAAPKRDSLRVDAGKAARMSDGRAPIRMLLFDVDQPARLALAGAEMPVVEHQHMPTFALKPLRIGVEQHLFNGAETMRHHDAGLVGGAVRFSVIEPADAALPIGEK